jgi:hypothetical protein
MLELITVQSKDVNLILLQKIIIKINSGLECFAMNRFYLIQK